MIEYVRVIHYFFACNYMSNVIYLSTLTPLFSKEGLGEILRNAIKIPLNPPETVSQ
jgi:hypothetical protein